MLVRIFNNLDKWISEQNVEARSEGLKSIANCTFRVLGQTALLEANLKLSLTATVDLDAYHDAEYSVIAKLSELLLQYGLEYDQLSSEIWMPEETVYSDFFSGDFVAVLLAKPEFVMISKALKAFAKNKILLRDYLALEPPLSFFELSEKYNVNLERLVLSDS